MSKIAVDLIVKLWALTLASVRETLLLSTFLLEWALLVVHSRWIKKATEFPPFVHNFFACTKTLFFSEDPHNSTVHDCEDHTFSCSCFIKLLLLLSAGEDISFLKVLCAILLSPAHSFPKWSPQWMDLHVWCPSWCNPPIYPGLGPTLAVHWLVTPRGWVCVSPMLKTITFLSKYEVPTTKCS